MEFTEALFGRRSIRKFRSDPVDPALLERLLEAAYSAPIGTRQECRYFVVLTGEEKERLIGEVIEPGLERLAGTLQASAAHDTLRYTRSLVGPLSQVPVLLMAYMELIDRDESLALPTVAAAVENLMLAAHDLGLGACWTTGATYLAESISEYLGVTDKQLVAMIPLGYPAETPQRRSRPVRAAWRGFEHAPETPEEKLPSPEQLLPEWLRGRPESPGAEILVVDDSHSARDSLRQALSEAGYSVQEREAAGGLVDAVREHPPALIILDAFLAHEYGDDLAGQVHAAVGGYVPILLTSGAYHLEDKARALALGADGFLGKPMRWPELLGQVRSLLRAKRLYDDLSRARADLEQLVRHRDRLTHMIVHDLRSPLSGIVGSVDYVLTDEASQLDEGARDLLQLSHGSGETLLGMVNDLLDVSRTAEVGLELAIEPVDVREIAVAAARQLTRLAEEKPLDLEVNVPDGLPPVPADRAKLQRVLVNLLGNAIKFTPAHGRVGVTAETHPEGATLRIAVSDTGKGIPEADRERIFGLFTQVEDDSAERREGTGLGLAFCKMVVDAHGGTITVDSREGGGSVFTVSLPLTRGDAAPAGAAAE